MDISSEWTADCFVKAAPSILKCNVNVVAQQLASLNPEQRAHFVSSTLCTEIFKSSKFMRQLLPSVPQRSVLPSWLNIRPTSEQICVRILNTPYCKSQYRLNGINNTLHLLKNTHRKTHAKFCHCRVKISISMREERKHLHKTASTQLKRSFLLRCLFFFTISLWSKQAPVSFTNFSLNERFPETKKRRRKGAISPGLF